MQLTGTAALITGGKRIGLVIAGELAARGVDVALTYARSRPEAEEAAGLVQAAGRRATIVQADLSQPGRLRDGRGEGRRGVRPARHPDQHGVGVQGAAVRRPDARPTGTRR